MSTNTRLRWSHQRLQAGEFRVRRLRRDMAQRHGDSFNLPLLLVSAVAAASWLWALVTLAFSL